MKALLFTLLFAFTCLTGRSQITDAGFEDWYKDTMGAWRLSSWDHFAGSMRTPTSYMFGTWRSDTAKQGNW